MTESKRLSAETLGQITLVQSMVLHLQDKKKIFNFVCRGLAEVPGVAKVASRIYQRNSKKQQNYTETPESVYKLAIKHKGHEHGQLIFHLSQEDKFTPYIPFIENLCNMLAVIFEERRQRKLNQSIMADLEKRIYERTRELELEVLERKEAVDALKRSEEKYRQIVETAQEGIWVIDADGNTTFVNARMAELIGCTIDDMMGKHLFSFMDEEGKEISARNLERRSNGIKETHEFKLLHKNGYPIWTLMSTNPLYDQRGNYIGALAMVSDITAQKQATEQIQRLNRELELRVKERTKQLEQSNKELEAFSYSVSHDLRTPLRAISGFSQMLLEDYMDRFDETGKDYITRVCAATKHMGTLIDDLLALARVTRSEITRESVNLSEIAESTITELQEIHPERCVEAQIAPNLIAEGDRILLRVALHNLLGNSWKFTKQKSQAKIEFSETWQNGRKVFYIRDNGAGFEQEYANKLFNPFQRFHKKNEFEGTGIGLATVQRIIHRHLGEIWAEGEVGKGATVYFRLPEK